LGEKKKRKKKKKKQIGPAGNASYSYEKSRQLTLHSADRGKEAFHSPDRQGSKAGGGGSVGKKKGGAIDSDLKFTTREGCHGMGVSKDERLRGFIPL